MPAEAARNWRRNHITDMAACGGKAATLPNLDSHPSSFMTAGHSVPTDANDRGLCSDQRFSWSRPRGGESYGSLTVRTGLIGARCGGVEADPPEQHVTDHPECRVVCSAAPPATGVAKPYEGVGLFAAGTVGVCNRRAVGRQSKPSCAGSRFAILPASRCSGRERKAE
jgi:hypothetical protein